MSCRRNAAEAAQRVQNYLQSKALLEAQLHEAEKAGASQEQIAALRQLAQTKGLGVALSGAVDTLRAAQSAAQARGQWIEQQEAADAAFPQQMQAEQQAESHRSQDRKIEHMEKKTSIARLEKKLKTHFRRPSDNQPPSNPVIILPLTAEQYVAVKNWNTAAQVGTVILSEGSGVVIGAIIGFVVGGPAGGLGGGVVGAIVGAAWGGYELSCITSVQDEFDKAYQQSSSVTVWRDGWKFNVDANNSDGVYTQANAPLSAAYVAVTTFLLTGKLP